MQEQDHSTFFDGLDVPTGLVSWKWLCGIRKLAIGLMLLLGHMVGHSVAYNSEKNSLLTLRMI
jgi:hypothetical protein